MSIDGKLFNFRLHFSFFWQTCANSRDSYVFRYALLTFMFYCCTGAFVKAIERRAHQPCNCADLACPCHYSWVLVPPPKFGASRKYFHTVTSFDMTACFDAGKPKDLLLFGFEFIELGNQPLHICMVVHFFARKPFAFQLLLKNSNFITNCLDLRLQVIPVSHRTC